VTTPGHVGDGGDDATMRDEDDVAADGAVADGAVDDGAVDDGAVADGAVTPDADQTPPAPTGVRAADDARHRLADVSDAPLEAHVDIYEDVHRRLHEGLADLDES
jgi:hypothetical protein